MIETVAYVDLDRGPVEVRFCPADDAAARRAPLVFLHEGLGSAATWRDFPEAVRQAFGGPARLVYSRHGYGHSARVPGSWPVSFMHHEADVILPELLARFELERPVLVGHSDGASIALLHAGGGHEVAALVLLAPHVFVEEATIAGIEAARDAFRSGNLRKRLARFHDDVDATFTGWCEVWLSRPFRAWNIQDRLPRITCPTLLVQGEADQYGTLAQLDAIEEAVRGPTRGVVVADVAHAPHLEAPGPTLGAIVSFLRVDPDRRLDGAAADPGPAPRRWRM